ncbi:MAG: hypothetical protein NW223_12515 [Hyphomicrobiaceae bacterium]|nr:hypothetical protein [Hyphomicrobiaceae bacterium]
MEPIAAYPRVVSHPAAREAAPAPYEAPRVNGKVQPVTAPVPQMMAGPPAAEVDYGQPAPAYSAQMPRTYAPRAGPTVYAPQPYAPQPQPGPGHAPQPQAAGGGARHGRRQRRPRPPARDKYRLGRGIALAAMGIGWLLIACGVLGPVQILLGVFATPLGTVGSVLVAGLLSVGGLFMLMAAHAVTAIFDQADTLRDLASLERSKRADDSRGDGA